MDCEMRRLIDAGGQSISPGAPVRLRQEVTVHSHRAVNPLSHYDHTRQDASTQIGTYIPLAAMFPVLAGIVITPAAGAAASPVECSTVKAALDRAWPVVRAKADLLQGQFLGAPALPTSEHSHSQPDIRRLRLRYRTRAQSDLPCPMLYAGPSIQSSASVQF